MLPPKFVIDTLGLTVRDRQGTGEKHLLRGVSAVIPEGRIYTIIGPSGSGKTSLLLTLNRMHDFTSGSIAMDGTDLRSFNVLELRRQVGLVFQKPFLLPGTVDDNIMIGPSLRKSKPRRTTQELLKLVGLDPALGGQEAQTLSGGEQQRVTLARVMANEPRVLLLDEVTSALDAASASLVEELVVRLNREEGITCVWVSHDLNQVERVGDHTLLLMEGMTVEEGPTAEFVKTPAAGAARQYLTSCRVKGETDE